MQTSAEGGVREDWEVVVRMLPEGWREKCKEVGALRRCRNIDDPETLLRVLMIHLADGCSLRETVVRASEGGLATLSDVALLKRLKTCGEWFRWIGQELMRQYGGVPPETLFPGVRVRLIDGSTVSEPGATGSSWRLHYSVCLPTLRCDEVLVTDPRMGESFKRFRVAPGDLLIADRGFAHRDGMAHVVTHGGQVLVRLNLTNVPLETAAGHPVSLLEQARTLAGTTPGEWPVWMRLAGARTGTRIAGRVCAIRKSTQATQRAQEKLRREAAKQRRHVKPETLEAAGYIFVLTTLPPSVSTAAVLEMYRGRWQIELAFKRLKSLLGIGHLKKTDGQGATAWVQGKLMLAFLIEALIAAAERFFPWGYPLAPTSP